jgi:hypothetical protein
MMRRGAVEGWCGALRISATLDAHDVSIVALCTIKAVIKRVVKIAALRKSSATEQRCPDRTRSLSWQRRLRILACPSAVR